MISPRISRRDSGCRRRRCLSFRCHLKRLLPASRRPPLQVTQVLNAQCSSSAKSLASVTVRAQQVDFSHTFEDLDFELSKVRLFEGASGDRAGGRERCLNLFPYPAILSPHCHPFVSGSAWLSRSHGFGSCATCSYWQSDNVFLQWRRASTLRLLHGGSPAPL